MRALFALFLSWGFLCVGNEQKADLVIFSYDRPLQLYALLESVEKYTTNLGEVHIILRCSDDRFRKAYQEVFDTFSSVYVNEHRNRDDFKEVFLRVVSQAPHEYIFFGVDDIIVTGHIDLDYCIRVMQKLNAYGFYLRMGKNCTKGYPDPYDISLPRFIYDQDDICAWQFNIGMYDWAYPHTVDMAVYKKQDIMHDLLSIAYHNPNTLEGHWAGQSYRIASKIGVCYNHSHMVNIPMNSVQEEAENYNMAISTIELLRIFNEGKKIDIDQFYQINNGNSHMNAWPVFIQR
jgi:hypothetical protein